TQAAKFVERFDVLDQFTENTFINGFSATVFRDKSSGQIYFVNRGTDDLFADGVLTDAALALSGKPLVQIVSMVNYYLRVQAGAGNVARQVEVDPLSVVSGVINFRLATSVTGVGAGIENASVVVAGHSLGGYLSTIFGYLFGATTASVFTYNAPGSWGIEGSIRNLAQLLGNASPSYAVDRQTNLIGDYLVSAVPGHRGSDIRLFEEGSAHSQKVLTDSLALYNLLAKLDPSLTSTTIDALLKASTAVDADSLEQTLDALRKTILGASIVPTKGTGTADSQASREAFYSNLYGLISAPQFVALIGSVYLESLVTKSADALTGLAKNGDLDALAYRYALKAGNPFALLGVDYATLHNSAGELDLYDPETGEGELTDAYLADRAAFLTWKLKLAVEDFKDTDGAYTKAGVDAFFNDMGSNLQINLGANGTSPSDKPRYIFGADQTDGSSEALSGGSQADHLYGGGGNDVLYGYDQNDYLEGNAGSDTLTGGLGRDTLLGGAGDDTLEGGKDNDRLNGGLGDDTYKFTSGDGWDWIEDQDGVGHIEYDGLTLGSQTIEEIAPNVWQEQTGSATVTYSLYTRSEGAETYPYLAIQGANGGMWVKRWSAGQLGITLPGAPPPEILPVGTPVSIIGKTTWYNEDHTVVDGRNLGRVDLAVVGDYGEVEGRGKLLGNDAANRLVSWGDGSELYGFGGRDTLIAMSGDDKLYGGDGDDALHGGADNDLLDGGSGNDLLAGGSGNDVLLGGDGDDLLFGSGSYEAWRADWSASVEENPIVVNINFFYGDPFTGGGGADLLRGGAGNDWLFGGEAADQLFGDDGNDHLYGEAGDDYLSGGEGDDWLVGDSTQDSAAPLEYAQVWYNPPQYHGNDILEGGAGDDHLIGAGGSDELYGGAGDDELVGDSDNLPIAYHGADLLYGGDGNDKLWGYGKDDQLYGGAGDDILVGDSGGDIAPADHGDDLLDGGSGDDILNGNGGNDTLLGGQGDDLLFGDDDDIPVAYQGADYLDGGDGDDYLWGFGGNDILFGGTGQDELAGDAGNDVLDGGDGDDLLDGGSGNDTLTGGTGTDAL
ncbi:MAG: hypothetical protein ACTS5I_02835, partial [Rhodanobacter sp.]